MSAILRRLALVAPVAFAGPSAAAPAGPFPVRGGITPIADVNANTAQGVSLLEFTVVTVEGVVQLGTGVVDPFDRSTPSTWFWVADGTGALAVAHPGSVLFPVTAGSGVQVTGLVVTQGVSPISGTRTLDFTGIPSAGVTVVGSGAVDPPVLIGASDLASGGAAREGTRVRIGGLTVVSPAEWPSAGASAFVRVTDGTVQVRLRIDDDTNLAGASPPAAAFDVVGWVSQDDAFPFNDNHYVYPSSLADLIIRDGSGLVTVDPSAVPRAATDVSLTFTVTGQEATLESVEIDVPVEWGWPSPSAPVLGGTGFSGAVPDLRFDGVRWILTASGAAVTATDFGTLTVAGLLAPDQLGSFEFTTRTATAGGTLTEVLSSPAVSVVAGSGDVLVNEVYCVTLSAGREEAEFVELRNVAAANLDIGGWTIADIGRTTSCTPDSRWAFPAGTILPAGGFAVVCRTALDPQNPGNPADDAGFKVEFPGFPPSTPLFETFDAQAELSRMDDPATPNMILRDPTSEDDQLALLGGPVTNGGQCESPNVPGRLVPFAELVLLRDATGRTIDAVTFQELGPCEFEFCGGAGAGEAYRAGPPKAGHTLGRDATSSDHPDSWEDLFPSSNPTPGAANLPGDTVAPVLVVDPASAGLSASMIEVRWDEPVLDAVATDPARWSVRDVGSGGAVPVVQVLNDPEEPGRHHYVVTAGMAAGAAGSLQATDIPDVAVGAGGAIVQGPNLADQTASFSVPGEGITIARIQEFDDVGFSPFAGDTVLIAGFVTLGDIPAVGTGEPPPVDRLSIWVQEPGGSGVNVFAFFPDAPADYQAQFPDVREFGVRLNDLVQVRGVVTEFVSSSSGAGAVTEVAGIAQDPTFYRFLLRGLPGPEPVEVTTRGANDERLEGTLVHTSGVVINSNALAAFIDDNTGSVQVFQNFSSLDLTRFTVGDRLDVTGVITQFDSHAPYFGGYELVPQNQDAIFEVDGSFAPEGPAVEVQKRVLVPDLGEKIRITATSPSRSQMIVEIYDMLGRKVTTLYDGVGLGPQTFDWDGVNQWGSVVAAGAYLCHVRAVSLDGGPVRTASAPIIVGLRLDGGSP